MASQIELKSCEIVFLRSMIGSIFLFLVFFLEKNKFHILEHRRNFLFITSSGISTGASWLFLYEAYQQVGVSLATLIYYCGPVIVMIFSSAIFNEKITLPKIISLVIVLVGIILITDKNNLEGGKFVGINMCIHVSCNIFLYGYTE